MSFVTRTLAGLAVVLSTSAAVVACRPAAEPRTVSMHMVGSPANASVTIDDIFVGRLDIVAARRVAHPVGTQRLSVGAPGYHTGVQIVEAKEGAGPVRLEVRLVATPD